MEPSQTPSQQPNDTEQQAVDLESASSKIKTKLNALVPKGAVRFGVLAIALVLLAGVSFGIFSNPTGPLTWSPPDLSNPKVVNVPTRGYYSVSLGDNEDAIVKFPNEKRIGATAIKGGRNIVIYGGHITTERDTSTSDTNKRAIYISGATGVVHIEGVLIDSSGGGDSDGIAINAPEAVVQIQNSRIVDLWGRKDRALGTHADIIQPWGGVKELRIDRLTGSSDYQGLEIKDDSGNVISAQIKNTNLIGNYPDTKVQKLDPKIAGGYLITLQWFRCPDSHGVVPKYTFDNVYLQPRSDKGSDPVSSMSNSVTPNESGCRLDFDTNEFGQTTMEWDTSVVDGEIIHGIPPAGDFVPVGVAGIGYESPGYQEGGSVPDVDDPNPNPDPQPDPEPEVEEATDDHIDCGDDDYIACEKFGDDGTVEAVRGEWTISDGVLSSSNPTSVDVGNGAIALLEETTDKPYELTVAMQVERDNEFDDVSLIFDYVDEDNYKFVSLNEQNDDKTSGVFTVVDGDVKEVADIELSIANNEWILVSLEREMGSARVTVNSEEVAFTSMLLGDDTSVGVGSRNNTIHVDYIFATEIEQAEEQEEDDEQPNPDDSDDTSDDSESDDSSDESSEYGFMGVTDGATVTNDTLYVNYVPEQSVSRANFYIDGEFIGTEKVAPYFLGGDDGIKPNGYSIEGLSVGEHTLEVRYQRKSDGKTGRAEVTFTIPAEDSVDTSIGLGFNGVSDGATVSGQIPVTYVPDEELDVRKIKFYVDGSYESSEAVAPYSLAGDSGDTIFDWDTEQLSNGEHTLRASITLQNGSVINDTISFTVDN